MVLAHLVCGTAAAQDRLHLEAATPGTPFQPPLQILADASGSLSWPEVRALDASRFALQADMPPSFGYTTTVYWVRLPVQVEPDSGPWLLELANKSVDDVRFYAAPDSSLLATVHTGDQVPFASRGTPYRSFVFPLPEHGSAPYTVYLRAASKGPMSLPVKIWRADTFAQHDRWVQFFLGAFFGILGIMALYNFLLFLAIRDRSYLYYVLYILSYIAYQVAVERVGLAHLWPEGLWWNERSFSVLGLVCAIWGLQFTRSFLHVPDYAPRLDRTLRVLMMLCGVLIVVNLFGPRPFVNRLTVPFFMVNAVVVLATGAVCLRRGNRVARYYLLAWTFLLVGIVVGMLRMLGAVPPNILVLRSVQIGAVLELTLFSLGLGYRYNALRKERERMRLQIASDLHDDIGSGLAQISLYSELVQRHTNGDAAAWAARSGDLARALSGKMQDIVWAIRPEQESWSNLELRMKDYAAEVTAPRGIALDMDGEVAYEHRRLPLPVLHNVLLMFKELLHNAVRHADCDALQVGWHLTRDRLWLRVRDNGCGFDPGAAHAGNGLKNLHRRAEEIGGTLTVDAAPGQATTVEIDIPL